MCDPVKINKTRRWVNIPASLPVVDLRDLSFEARGGERGRCLGFAGDDVDDAVGLGSPVADPAGRPVGASPSPIGHKDRNLG